MLTEDQVRAIYAESMKHRDPVPYIQLIANLRDAAALPTGLYAEAADALEKAERKLGIATDAMQNLVAVKGRYHTEQAYNRIVEALKQIGDVK